MTESLPGGPKVLTHAQLDAHVKSLRSVGGIYKLIAQCVEHDNRSFCTGERTEHDQARDR